MRIYLKALLRVIFKRGLPVQLIYFVTSKCNSHCNHCFLQGSLNRETNFLKLDEIEKIAKAMPCLLSLSLTGGEPFLREDLPEIAKLFYKHGGFKNLTIISNGLETDRIAARMEQILLGCRNANVFVGLSFDGLEHTHNSIRGVKDAFSKTKETFFKLKGLKKQYKNLSVGTSTTCSPINQPELLELYNFLFSLGPDGIGINLLRGKDWREYVSGIDLKWYRNFTERKLKDWKEGHLGHSNICYNRLLYAKEATQHKLIARTYSEQRYLTPCYAGRLLAVMKESGDVYPCEMIEESMGNIREFGYDFEKLWSGKAARLMRKNIRRSCCFCTYECATTSNILFNLRYVPVLIKETLIKKKAVV